MSFSFGSVCSGIEAASVAWNPLGWEAAWFSEIEPFPCALLAHHYPNVPNLGDMTTIAPRILSGEVEAPDILCGGTPCQAFSVAGLRKSLDDARGNLSLVFCELANAIDTARFVRGLPPSIIFWENVPGVLNTKDNAFGCFLAGLAQCDVPLEVPGGKWGGAGYVLTGKRAVAWRTLDAQYFGVPQRRRRVFVVASSRDGFDPCQILFECAGVQRNPAPVGTPGKAPAAFAEGSFGAFRARSVASTCKASRGCLGGGGLRTSFLPTVFPTIDACIYSRRGQQDNNKYLIDDSLPNPNVSKQRWGGDKGVLVQKEKSGTLGTTNDQTLIAIAGNTIGRKPLNGGNGNGFETDGKMYTLTATDIYGVCYENHAQDARYTEKTTCPTVTSRYGTGGGNVPLTLFNAQGQDARYKQDKISNTLTLRDIPIAGNKLQVRRLTPVECERLQGFPDNYTRIPYRGKPESECPDGPRYKAIGNSWAVPVIRWLGERINNELNNR